MLDTTRDMASCGPVYTKQSGILRTVWIDGLNVTPIALRWKPGHEGWVYLDSWSPWPGIDGDLVKRYSKQMKQVYNPDFGMFERAIRFGVVTCTIEFAFGKSEYFGQPVVRPALGELRELNRILLESQAHFGAAAMPQHGILKGTTS